MHKSVKYLINKSAHILKLCAHTQPTLTKGILNDKINKRYDSTIQAILISNSVIL